MFFSLVTLENLRVGRFHIQKRQYLRFGRVVGKYTFPAIVGHDSQEYS